MAGENVMTDEFGHKIGNDNYSLTAGNGGPILISDYNLINKLAHFDRERIPERVVHAKGAGAHGYFEVTADVTKYTKAKFMNKVGKKTPVFVRFSTVGGEKGSADTARDPRGFAIKHYTEDGNYDMVGNNTPVFFVRDPQKFPDFIHTQKRNPQTNLPDPTMFWDFLSQTPESFHQVLILFSNRGTPDGYRHMNGYSSHTYIWVNEKGEQFYVKLHYKTESGIKNLKADEAQDLAGKDPDYATRDLFNHIEKGGVAEWKACVQVMPVADAKKYKWDVLDITKVWPHSDYPLITYGKLVLNRNPQNYFAETEQSAFSPANLVPGVQASADKMLQGRLFSYNDTHRHRLGGNYTQIPINAPLRTTTKLYYRDGFMCVNGNGGSGPNYHPNTKDGAPKQDERYEEVQTEIYGSQTYRGPRDHKNDDFEQPGNLFANVLNESEQQDLINNMGGHLKDADSDIQVRVLKILAKINNKLAKGVAGVCGNTSKL